MSTGVKELIEKINAKLTKQGKTKVAFAHEINKYLPTHMRREVTISRKVLIYRYLKHGCSNGEVVLAMEKWLQNQ